MNVNAVAISTIIYTVFGAYFLLLLTMIIIRKYTSKHHQFQKIKYIDRIKNPLSTIQNLYFPDKLNYDSYCIYEDYLDLFNEYIKITPKVLDGLITIERSLLVIEKDLDNNVLDEKYYIDKLDYIEADIDSFIEFANHFMIHAVEIIQMNESKNEKINLHCTRIQKYIEDINRLGLLSETHLLHSFRLLKKIQKKMPSLESRFRRISRKLIFIYYNGLFGASRVLNDNIFAYNDINIKNGKDVQNSNEQ